MSLLGVLGFFTFIVALVLAVNWIGGWVDSKTAGIAGAIIATLVTSYLIAGARQAAQESFQPRPAPICKQTRTC